MARLKSLESINRPGVICVRLKDIPQELRLTHGLTPVILYLDQKGPKESLTQPTDQVLKTTDITANLIPITDLTRDPKKFTHPLTTENHIPNLLDITAKLAHFLNPDIILDRHQDQDQPLQDHRFQEHLRDHPHVLHPVHPTILNQQKSGKNNPKTKSRQRENSPWRFSLSLRFFISKILYL